jgi:hypothetical protein
LIQIAAGDLVAVEANGRHHYALILDKIRLFGGNWSFAFHRTSVDVLSPAELLRDAPQGFHAFVDFIWAKREKRLRRLARGLDTRSFQGSGRLKGTNAVNQKATLWFIYDMDFQELKRVAQLTAEEATYPDHSRIDDVLMVERIAQKWTPDRDPRI